MQKFKITAYVPKEIEIEIEDGERIENYLRDNYDKLNIKHTLPEWIEPQPQTDKEWYCTWIGSTGHRQVKVIVAPSESYVYYNIRPELDWEIYDFYCVLNTPEKVDALWCSLID